MYGIKRIEYSEDHWLHIVAVEFHEGVSDESIKKAMEELDLPALKTNRPMIYDDTTTPNPLDNEYIISG